MTVRTELINLVLETLVGIKDKNDYLELARRSVANALAWHVIIEAALEKVQVHGTSSRNLEEHTGIYTNSIKTMKIEVRHGDHGLYFAIQGVESEKYEMTHYQDDIFTWLRPRN